MNNYYPVFVNLKDQPCVVVGGGKIAEGKVTGLLDASAVVTVISPEITPALLNLVERKQITWIGRVYQAGDLYGAFLVICATDQTQVNHQVWLEASENHQLVNVVDDTPRCNFIAPAILRKGDLSIAISTAGKAPAVAVRLKQLLDETIGPEYARFLELAGQLRTPLAKHIPDFETRKALWYQMLDTGVLELLAQGDESKAIELISSTIGFQFLPAFEGGPLIETRPMTLTFATRGSALARWQTNYVIQRIQSIWPSIECDERIIATQGDKILDRPLPEIGGKGLFTDELESCLLNSEVHIAVHSLKDLPVEDTPGLIVAAIPIRDSAFDVLVSPNGYTINTLPQGARVGTCSLRRAAQILALRPDLTMLAIRGNVDTRLKKVINGEYEAIVLAAAGLSRLKLDSHITETFPLNIMLPAPGQGALAVQCRADDEETRKILAALHDPSTAASVYAERAFLSNLGGGCSLPIGAFAQISNEKIILTGVVIARDGQRAIRLSAVDTDPHKLGERLAKLAIERGAGELLI